MELSGGGASDAVSARAGETKLSSAWLLAAGWLLLHGLCVLSYPIYDPPDTLSYEAIADVLSGERPFPAEGLHFPPGYALAIAAARPVFGASYPYALVCGQHVCVLLAALLLLDLGKCIARPRIGLFAAIMTVASPMLMVWSQTLYTEIATAFLLVVTVWGCVRALSSAHPYRLALAASAAIALAGLMRQAPYILALPAALYLFGERKRFSAAGRWIVPALPLAVSGLTILAWCLFTFSQSHRFEHSSGGARHVYNRVVHTDGTLATGAPATRRLLSLLSTEEALEPHWTAYGLLQERGLSSDEANRLMADVSRESILHAPAKYAFNTFRLFLRYWFIEPDMLVADVRCESISPRLLAAYKPSLTLLFYLTGHWLMGWLALWGTLAACRRPRLPALQLAAVVVAIYLAVHAAAEWESSRFGIPVFPLLALLAGYGLSATGRWIDGAPAGGFGRPNRAGLVD